MTAPSALEIPKETKAPIAPSPFKIPGASPDKLTPKAPKPML